MAEKSNRSKPLGLSTKIKNSMMDFTDIKYPNTNASNKPYLKNSSSMDSSETILSPSPQYDDEEFDTSSTTQTHGTNELNNNSDAIESIDELNTIGDYNYEKYQSYSDQRNVDIVEVKRNDDVTLTDIEKLRKNVQAEIVHNESFLDQFCESLSKDVKIASKDVKATSKDIHTISKDVKVNVEKGRIPIRPSIKGKESAGKKGRINSSSIKKKTLDPTKKTELLAQLKAIDGAD